MAVNGIKKAREYTPFVEFSCEDFARTDLDYTIEIVKAAVEAGATTINLPDTVGYRFPDEIFEMVKKVIKEVGRDDVIYSMHAHNDLGCATANSLAALKAGVRQVEVTMNGIGERAGNTALEEIIAAVSERSDYFNLKTRINTKKIVPISKLVSRIVGISPQPNKSIVGENAFRHSSGIHTHGMLKNRKTYEWIEPERYGGKSEMPLTARSGKAQVQRILDKKGIRYNGEDLDEIVERFKEIADKLNEVYDDTLVKAVRGVNEIPEYFKLLEFKAWYDSVDGGNAKIKAKVGEEEKEIIARGNGMINATQNAVNQLNGVSLNIRDYHSAAISEGGEAKGIEEFVVSNKGFYVKGTGISEDTVYGAAKALIDASNKMKFVRDNCC